jgi:glyoxylase-like metal-dependent hydrolase (beta-lactamase superfamily II)
MEIASGVHAVPLIGATGHVIIEDRLTLIDAGLPGSGRRLAGYLARVGRSIDDLDRIVCTHGHPDHIGGVRELARDGVDVYLHPADEPALQVSLREALMRPTRGKLFGYAARTPHRTLPMADGDVLPVLGGLEVIHTPGHTPGSICLYARRDGLLFVGDALEVRLGKVTFASPLFSDDLATARQSVKRMAERDVNTIVFGHDKPWRADANGLLAGLAAEARRPANGERGSEG